MRFLWNEKASQCKKSCCRDEQKQLKLNADHKAAESAVQLMQSVSAAVPITFSAIPVIHFSSVSVAVPSSHAPPETFPVAVYIRHCSFLI